MKIQNTTNSNRKFMGKWLVISPVVAAIAIAAAAIAYTPLITDVNNTQAQAQEPSLGQLLRSIRPITVQPTIVNEKLTSVDGILLTEVAKSTTSLTTESVDGMIKSVTQDGQAEIAILRGTNPGTADNIIAFRITNTGQNSFKIVSFGMEGSTKSGFIPMKVLAVSEKNNAKLNVAIRDAVLLNPDESMTGYIIGKWKAAEINEDLTEFQAGAVYRYETADTVKVWSIGTDIYSLS
ncbi:MAG TPA: hypothetical protein VNI77_05630 [Nitrososphaera sp.]|nr:hypothetical protein [Nitrososphaera sp.]